MRKEEEAATLSLRLSCLLDFFDIFVRIQRLFDHVRIDIVRNSYFTEFSSCKLLNNNLFKDLLLDYSTCVRFGFGLPMILLHNCLVIILRYVEDAKLATHMMLFSVQRILITIFIILVLS